uniref:Uncharacterized protein n=1 Tax=Cannabis sativa TaxID=3483 RepID=A0A803P637_CANSA
MNKLILPVPPRSNGGGCDYEPLQRKRSGEEAMGLEERERANTNVAWPKHKQSSVPPSSSSSQISHTGAAQSSASRRAGRSAASSY